MPPMGLSWLPMTQPRIPHGPTGTPRGAPIAPHGTFMAPHEAPVDFSIAVLGNAMAHIACLAISSRAPTRQNIMCFLFGIALYHEGKTAFLHYRRTVFSIHAVLVNHTFARF